MDLYDSDLDLEAMIQEEHEVRMGELA